MTELWKLSASALQDAYRNGQLRPSEVAEAVINRAETVDPIVNIFATRDFDTALHAARASDARFGAGTPLGALDGVPVTIKDNIPLAGLPCAWGSALWRDRLAEADELPVARMRAQGAVFLGKTNVSEFTLGRGNVDTPSFGTTRNPWNPDLTSGSSTGGGAAAAASGIGPIALGTDGGGSIRRPAGYNNLVGLKPSAGRVARIDGLPPILHDFEVIGPLTRTVTDAALTLAAIEGPHPRDRSSFGFAPGRLSPPKPRLRILHLRQLGNFQVDEEIAQSCDTVARNLTALGHWIETGPAPFDVALFEQHWPVVSASGLAWLLKDIDWQGRIGAPYPPMIEKGSSLTAIDYIDTLDAYRRIYRQIAAAFAGFDLILSPTSGAMPWPAQEYGPPWHRAFTGFVNVTGLPAISLPGPRAGTVPVGFQLVAAFARDWTLLSVAQQYEAAFPWATEWPLISA